MKTLHGNIATVVGFVIVALAGTLPNRASADPPNEKTANQTAYAVETSRKDTADDFNAFLDRCSLEERVCLMQSMMGLDGAKLKRHHFGKVAGLNDWADYADRRKDATPEKPFRPETYNDVAPATVMDAIERAILSEDVVSPDAIRRQLQWICFSKARYHFFDHGRVDYHKQALQWVCRKQDISDADIKSLSTFELESKLVERSFETFWNKLSPEQRLELLGNVENWTQTEINDKAAVVGMSAGSALAAVGLYALFSSTTTVYAASAGYATGVIAGSTMIGGPVGWGMAAVSLGVHTAIIYNWPDSQRTANFVITVHLIKERWIQDASKK